MGGSPCPSIRPGVGPDYGETQTKTVLRGLWRVHGTDRLAGAPDIRRKGMDVPAFMRTGLGEGAVKHGRRYTFQQGCRCEPCTTASRAYGRAYRVRSGAITGNREGRYSRSGVRVESILPDLAALLRVTESRAGVSERLGFDKSWVSRILNGGQKRVHLGTAQKIAELARASRNLAEEWAKQEHARQVKREYERDRQKHRKDHAGRRPVTHDDHVCTHCGGRLDSAHALWTHSRSKHKDKPTQGKNQWSSFRVKR